MGRDILAAGEQGAAGRVVRAFPNKAAAAAWAAGLCAVPGSGCGDKSRPAGVYSDYTYPSPDNISLKSLLPQEGGGKSCHFGGLHGVFQLLQPLTA